MSDSFSFLFLADCQLGFRAMISQSTQKHLDWHAQMGSKITPVPPTEGFEWEAKRYRRVIEIANNLGPSFVVMGGDMINDSTSGEQLEAFLEITSQLDPSIPMRMVPGNHDLAADAITPDGHSIDKYREIFGPDYYAFDHGPVRFIVLDTVVIDRPELVPGELEEQMAFIEYELRRCGETQRNVIIIGHHPLFLRDADEPDTYWNLPRERRLPILELLKECGVRLGFSGHWHRNGIAWDGDFEMVISGPVGFPLGDDPPGYRAVDVSRGQVTHRYHAL